MTEEYAEQLGRWVKERKSTKRDANLAAFLLIRHDVRIALDNGYPAKTIWRNMKESGRIAFCYESFLHLVRRQIRNRTKPVVMPAQNKPHREKAKAPGPQQCGPTSARPSDSLKGFTFNATPKKEDLL